MEERALRRMWDYYFTNEEYKHEIELAEKEFFFNIKEELEIINDSLNPAELKRRIDEKVKKLYEVYKRKKGSQQVDASPNSTPSTVSYYLIHQL
jgi:DNA primase large subunit